MTQNNMPDVLYAYREPFGDIGCLQHQPALPLQGVTSYTRDGAPSPWIDPKVQPIPDGLDDDQMLWVKHKVYETEEIEVTFYEYWQITTLSIEVLGYIMLPPE